MAAGILLLSPVMMPVTVYADGSTTIQSEDTSEEKSGSGSEEMSEPSSGMTEDSSESKPETSEAASEATSESASESTSELTSEKGENSSETASEPSSESTSENRSESSSEEKEDRNELHTVMSETKSSVELSVFSSLDDSTVKVNPLGVRAREEGLEVLEGYSITGKNEGKKDSTENTDISGQKDSIKDADEDAGDENLKDNGEAGKEEHGDPINEESSEKADSDESEETEEPEEETLYVKAEPTGELNLQPKERVSLYSVENHILKDILIEDITEESELLEIDEDVSGIALVKDTGYRRLSLQLFPNTTDSDKTIKLEGMMPKEAWARATEVDGTENGTFAKETREILAAYDISIYDGETKYQPGEERPVSVSICDERISAENENLELWHVLDDGTREKITEFTVEYGKICFEAVGFSVYEIVDLVKNPDIDIISYLTEHGEEGFYVSFIASQYGNGSNGPFYFAEGTYPNVVNTGRTGLNITDISLTVPENAIKLYFEHDENAADNQFYIYELGENSEKKYIRMFRNNNWNPGRSALDYATNENPKTLFTLVSNSNSQIQISATVNGETHYWVRNTRDNKIAVVGYNNPDDISKVWMTVPISSLDLNGKTYGLMNYTGGTHGYALMADSSGENVHSLVELVTHQMVDENGHQIESRTLYVDEGSEVTKWTFHNVSSDNYKLSASTENGEKYLAVQNDALVLVDDADAATTFLVSSDANGRVQLSYQNKYVSFYINDNGENSEIGFGLSTNNNANTWLNLIDFATLSDENLITYSADRISVSDAVNGQKVIVYTRIWNEDTLRYDIYAVDYNGTLYPCYASGGKILWLGDGTGSLEWEFTEYLDAVTKEPNYYYELFNPYSEKYLAPQMNGNQILSENTIGINMQGRRNGEYYSDIVAWDNTRYAFVGLKPNDEKTKLIPCSQSNSVPFYFATLEELNLSDKLHEVRTLDNNEYGITMRMVDYANRTVENNVLGTTTGNVESRGEKRILSTKLETDGYPIATQTNSSLSGLFGNNAIDVNHLFIESIYDASGYFEFDSCQNFATLCDSDGNLKTGEDAGNFTVYRELGTNDANSRSTLKHGQFLPFNTIKAGEYATENNPLNLYSALAQYQKDEIGKLDENDPRKYEKLYKVTKAANYNNGMELEASFVQTVSGLDAWGHDIIFEFTGDDDFWLYVDDELVIDLGGIHSALAGSVNFKTGKVIVDGFPERTLRDIFKTNYKERNPEATEAEVNAYLSDYFDGNETVFKDYSKHTMKVFYMERGEGASNLHMRFNLASVTPGHVVVSKNIEGEGAALLDKEFLEYPFQIYYTLPEDESGTPGVEQLLGNDDEHIRVTYQNSNQPVTFVQKYRPPGFTDEEAYENIYFINPTKKAEIAFPDNTISYRIVECAVDNTVYPNVKINGENVPSNRISRQKNFISYSSEVGTAENKPSISFDNFVNANVIKDLYVTKKLLDENNQEITNDPATFSFRLSLSSVDVSADDIPKANMAKYFVLSPNKKVCRYDSAHQTFSETAIEADGSFSSLLKDLSDGPVDGVNYDDVVFRTSGFGAISGIPAGYTIVVPGLPVGAVFKVTEDVKSGYGLMGYERVMGEKISGDNIHTDIPSYMEYDNNPLNIGKVIVDSDPRMEVHNRKGYGLTVNKKWSDLNLTTSHDSVYVAVYVDGALLDGTVKEIKSPSTSAYYFWTTLKDNADGSARTDFTGYEIREVTLSGNYSVADDGTVTGYDWNAVTPLNSGAEIVLTATRTEEATPDGESRDTDYTYVVTYQEGTDDSSTRTDTISNTRKGGVAVRLFEWDSINPLKGGYFTLKDHAGNKIGDYISDSEGIVTMLYEFNYNELYTLTETSAPEGYVGLQKKCCFKVNYDETISLFYEDGTTVWGENDNDDTKWVKTSPGNNGIKGFVDVYNKKFNFIIAKYDKNNTEKSLESAHFALYKQVKATISGYIKNKDPMTGFEDFETDENGIVYVCGGNSGRVIKPGEKGSVYFLTEIQAPAGYTKLDEDIIFRISPIGVPTLISDSSIGDLVETEDSYVFTLSVPNERSNDGLTITKTVTGNMGDKTKEFTFSFEVNQLPAGSNVTEFSWKKNGVEQNTPIQSGDTFTLGHKDNVTINVPEGIVVTITEELPANESYTTTFKLNDEAPQTASSLEFTADNSTILSVVNERTAVIPTGVWMPIGGMVALALVIFAGGMVTVLNRRRYREYL